MTKRELVEEYLSQGLGPDDPVAAMFADGHDDAIVGVVDGFGVPTRVLYDRGLVIKSLMKQLGCDYQEAVEFFDYNVAGAWVGDGTPMYCTLVKQLKEELV